MITEEMYTDSFTQNQHDILSRDARWMNIIWNAYMKRQRRMNEDLEEYEESHYCQKNQDTETFQMCNQLQNTEDWD